MDGLFPTAVWIATHNWWKIIHIKMCLNCVYIVSEYCTGFLRVFIENVL